MHIKKNPWWGMLALTPATAMSFLDQTILPVALPAIQHQFVASDVGMQWSVNSYLLAVALFVLLGGKLVDAWGGRSVFVAACALFVGSSIGCGLSPSLGWLIGGRFLQGLAGALLIPSSASLMLELFPAQRRGRAVGFNVSIGSIFLILGPIIGAYLTENFSWPWVFWINLPLGAMSIVATWMLFPQGKTNRLAVDGWGSLWFSLAVGGWVVAVMQGPAWSWLSPETLGCAGIGTIGLLLLLQREKKAKHPYLELSLLRYPVFRAATLSVAAASAILMLGVFWAVFFQQTLGYTAMEAGLFTFVSALPVLYMSPIAGAVSDKLGPKALISTGFLAILCGLGLVAFFCDRSPELLFLGLLTYGTGVPLIMTPSYSAGLSAVPSSKAGLAAGMLGTFRMLASTFALAAMGAGLAQFSLRNFVPKVSTAPLNLVSAERARAMVLSEPGAGWDQLTASSAEQLRALLREADISALQSLHVVVMILVVGMSALVLQVFKKRAIPPHEQGIGEGWDP